MRQKLLTGLLALLLAACQVHGSAPAPSQPAPAASPTSSPTFTPAAPTATVTPLPEITPQPTYHSTSPDLTKIAAFGKGSISPVFRSPDGKTVIVGRIDGMARWYDTETGKEEGAIDTDIHEVFFSSDSKFAVLKTFLGLTVVNLDTGKVIADLPDGAIAYRTSPTFSPNMQFIALLNAVRTSRAFYEHIEIIRLAGNGDPELLPILNEDEERFMSAPTISPDSTLVAAGCSDKRVYVWDVESGEIRFALEGHTDNVRGVAFSLDGSMLVSSSDDGTLRIWDSTMGKQVRIFRGFSAGFPWVSFTKDNMIRLGAANEAKDLFIDPFTGGKTSLPRILTKTPDPFERNLHLLGYLTDEGAGSNPVQFSPDGKTLAIGGRNILLWDIKTQHLLFSFEVIGSRSVTSLVFSPDGKWLAASLLDNGLQVWNTRTGQTIFEHAIDPGMGIYSVYTPAFSPDSKQLAFGIENSIEIWDLNSQKLQKSINLPEKNQFASQVAFSQDGNQIYSIINWNMGGQVWNLESGNLVTKIGFEGYHQGFFSASDLYPPFFARNNGDQNTTWIDLWNMDTGQVKRLAVENGLNEPVMFSPDGSLLVAINDLQQLLIWDTETGSLLLDQHVDYRADLAINPAVGLIAAGHDGIVELYDLSLLTQIEKASKILTPSSTP